MSSVDVTGMFGIRQQLERIADILEKIYNYQVTKDNLAMQQKEPYRNY